MMPCVRLIDQIGLVHGPIGLLEHSLTRLEAGAGERGLIVTVEHDFFLLAETWEKIRKTGNPLVPNFNAKSGYSGRDGYWLAARDAENDIVATLIGRIYNWENTTLRRQLSSLDFFRAEKIDNASELSGVCVDDTKFSELICGKVLYGGGAWVRGDARGTGIMALLPRISKIYALTRWGFDYSVTLMEPILIDKGVSNRYGFANIEKEINVMLEFGNYKFNLGWLECSEFVDDLFATAGQQEPGPKQ